MVFCCWPHILCQIYHENDINYIKTTHAFSGPAPDRHKNHLRKINNLHQMKCLNGHTKYDFDGESCAMMTQTNYEKWLTKQNPKYEFITYSKQFWNFRKKIYIYLLRWVSRNLEFSSPLLSPRRSYSASWIRESWNRASKAPEAAKNDDTNKFSKTHIFMFFWGKTHTLWRWCSG